MTRKFLLITKESMDDSYATGEAIRRLGPIKVISSDDQWKLRHEHECALTIELEDKDVSKIYSWFTEAPHNSPFPSGTLLYFKELI